MPQVGEHILHRRFSIGTRAGDKGMDGFCRPFSPIMVLGQSLDWICLQRLCCQRHRVEIDAALCDKALNKTKGEWPGLFFICVIRHGFSVNATAEWLRLPGRCSDEEKQPEGCLGLDINEL